MTLDTTRFQDYCRAKEKISQVLFRVSNRGKFFVVKGKEIPEAEFLAANRVELRKKHSQVSNPDKKRV